MFAYQCQLAWRSIKKNLALCSLMVLMFGVGVAAMMITYTAKYAIGKNTLPHKNETLFYVQTDSWKEQEAYDYGVSNKMPDGMSYRDASAFIESDIATRKTVITATGGTISMSDSEVKPLLMHGSVVTHDFFSMFDRKFIYGGAWAETADAGLEDVMIITRSTNNAFFSGANSIGKMLLFDGVPYKIVGVVDDQVGYNMQYIEGGIFAAREQFFVAFGVFTKRNISVWRSVLCPDTHYDYGSNLESLLESNCVWFSHWVEFSSIEQKQRYGKFIEDYIKQQKLQGRYPRPVRYALSNIPEKKSINAKQTYFFTIIFYFGLAFFLVCTLNAIAMLMAKFMQALPETGVRRALGAGRHSIFLQHIIEASILGGMGGLLGVIITFSGLSVLKWAFIPSPSLNGVSQVSLELLFVPDGTIFICTLIGSFLASVFAGIYPSWRVCCTPPAQYLKLQ